MKRFLSILPLMTILVGCGSPSGSENPSAGVVNSGPPVKQIGDGSAISFKEWKGLRKGDGSLNQGSVSTPLEVVNFDLKADGKLEIKLTGPKYPETTFSGMWKRKDEKTVELDISEGVGKAGVNATGTMKFMDSENPYELVLEGKFVNGGDAFNVNFRMGG